MAKIALEGATIAQSTAPNHITYRVWEYTGNNTPPYCSGGYVDGVCQGWSGGAPIYDWKYYTAPATVNGTAKSTVTNVKINGKSPIVVGDKTTEKDTYSISGEYVSGAHDNAQGNVTIGNTKNVYVNGKLVVVGGASSVTTHAGSNVAITGGLSTTVNIGG